MSCSFIYCLGLGSVAPFSTDDLSNFIISLFRVWNFSSLNVCVCNVFGFLSFFVLGSLLSARINLSPHRLLSATTCMQITYNASLYCLFFISVYVNNRTFYDRFLFGSLKITNDLLCLQLKSTRPVRLIWTSNKLRQTRGGSTGGRGAAAPNGKCGPPFWPSLPILLLSPWIIVV